MTALATPTSRRVRLAALLAPYRVTSAEKLLAVSVARVTSTPAAATSRTAAA